jgi:hypothetical protein
MVSSSEEILPMIEILSDQWLVTVHREGELIRRTKETNTAKI